MKMTALASKTQRLRTLEKQIRKDAQAMESKAIAIGRALKEIKADALWEGDYTSWTDYLKHCSEDVIGRSQSNAQQLLVAAEVEAKLPSRIRTNSTLRHTHLFQLSRLAPNKPHAEHAGQVEKDYSKLRPKDIERVVKSAESNGDKLTVDAVKAAVDADLGIKKKPKPKAVPIGIDLDTMLRAQAESLEGVLADIEDLSSDVWELLEQDHPGLVDRLAVACDALADFLRS